MKAFLLGLVFVGLSVFAVPGETLGAGLVPCNGPECQVCHFVELGSNILNWLIGIMATVCAVMIAVAGLKMATAGGNTGQVSSAKEMMTNTIIGFIILLAAWLIVDTVLRVFVSGSSDGDGSAAVIPGFGPWNDIQCVTQPVTTPTEEPTTDPIAQCEAQGGIWNNTTGQCEGVVTTACPISPLPPITDPLALQMEGGQTVIWNNPTLQACVNKFIQQVGGSVTSAYRPPEYQTHLKAVHTLWCTQLQSNTDPNCSTLKSTVQAEMNKHALSCSRPVGVTSNHSSGRAVDISGPAHGTQAVKDAASANCLSWPLGASDPVHYELVTGCTCN